MATVNSITGNNTNPLTGTSSSSSSGTGTVINPMSSMNPSDFINMMVTQLQNQDPLQPTSNEDLLQQISQIGQMQSSSDLQSSLQTLVLQDDISSASNMIGKQVTGEDSNGVQMSGVVNSVQVANNQVSLSLDSGQSLSLSQITAVKPVATAAAGAAAGVGAITP